MPQARKTTARRRPTVDPVWAIALDEIELQIKALPANMRRGSAGWLREARKTIRDSERALGTGTRRTRRPASRRAR